ncbi:MAG: patatin-like phospholipase family protein [Bacteroidales bacterium]|nr:patatin-like phospholipase family protein [Bacteroidales bacterium]
MLKKSRPYKLGVALSGGGARGFAHAGALQALEEEGLKPDIIAGVSAGSVISALYGAGTVPSLMPMLFSQVSFFNSCAFTVGNGGIFKMDKFKAFLKRNFRGRELLEEMRIPVHICATDLDHCCPVDFTTGPIAERVVASCSIPILFAPVKVDGINCVDGGVLRNLPAWAIRDQCERLIGVNCSPLVSGRCKRSIVDVAQRTYELMAKTNAQLDMAMCDLVVETRDIAHHRAFNMKETESVFRSGYEATKTALIAAGWIKPIKS